jgi:peptidoglycan/xylan/chitin deacetylase (PgdA/CDA1 family)
MTLLRRSLVRLAVAAAGGVVVAGAARLPNLLDPQLWPQGGYAAAADLPGWERSGQIRTTWYVPTARPLVALTFDDGPGPDWTPMVLDTLAAASAPATFFMVGQRLRQWSGLVAGRLEGHEVGNHTWSHADLATLDPDAARTELQRTTRRSTGSPGQPQLMRPPYGHLGGAAMVAADDLDYEIVLWSQKMHEASHLHDPKGLVDTAVRAAHPGSILLAHDVGTPNRLVALRYLDAIITGLRARGYGLVTVTELLASGTDPSTTASDPARPIRTGR